MTEFDRLYIYIWLTLLKRSTVVNAFNMSGHKNAMDLKQFEEHMWRLSTTGFTMVSVMFGNELGLFDIMEDANRPLTSSEIAELAGLKERYIIWFT